MLLALMSLWMSPNYAPIFVGRFDTADFPNAQRIERRMPNADMNQRVEAILAQDCKLAGQTKLRFDITVPYAVLLDANGKAKKVVVKDINCPPLEKLVGQIGSELASHGDFKVAHTEGDRWYVSETSFARLSEELTREQKDLDKVVCKNDRPKINSRIAMVKVCRTVAEWNMFEKDRDQYRRDHMGSDHKDMNPAGDVCVGMQGLGCGPG